ncbi:membrane dipeptidase [Alkalicoccobacillus porphyridii]|uniref:Membrane dipeptidase n=2 Tax=Alkalicoccobacillus porphyridii TaxID=2597270 RepID=A0A553ZV20_9BACI|nr:membrane dipeptidase [Alkalicoccobacillus porphyridii]
MQFPLIDTHCDVLLKLWMNPQLSFYDSDELDVNLQRLHHAGIKVQCFALFVEPFVKQELTFQTVLEQIRLFHQKVVRPYPEIKHVKSWEELSELKANEIGAILTLEGMDAVGTDEEKHQILIEQGVLSVGLTWNHANLCADGAKESRGAGLTDFGRSVVKRHNDHKILTDVSHLSERGFWDVMDESEYVIASHSNAASICPHPRNLNDDQAKALFKQKRYMGIVFFPEFLTGRDDAELSNIIRHIDYLCSIGGEKSIGFGSDFDGISKHVTQLSHAGDYPRLLDELSKYYSDDQINDFCSRNFLRSIP